MLIDTIKEYREVIEHLNQFEMLTVDTETTGLNPYRGARMCGLAIGGPKDEFYIPFRHEEGRNIPLELLPELHPLLSHPDKSYIGFNYKFDLQIMAMDGVPLPVKIEEVLAAAHLMNENENKKLLKEDEKRMKADGKMLPSFKLKFLGQKYLYDGAADESDKLIELIIVRGFTKSIDEAKGLMWKLSAAEVAPYACEDVKLTRGLYEFYQEPLKIWHLYEMYKELCEYHIITTKMEMRGITLDVPLIKEYMAEADAMKAPAKAELDRLAGYDINPNSHKQVQAAMGLKSTRKEILEDILESESADPFQKAFAQALVDYRGWKTVNGTYYSRFLEEIGDDGFIHPNLSLIGTISGRLSCFSPNLQGIPRYSSVYKVKDVFMARPGFTLGSFDYQQAEMRLAAHYMEILIESLLESARLVLNTSSDSKLIKKAAATIKKYDKPYEETLSYILMNGISMHTETQRSVFGTTDKGLVDYDYAKRTNFSVIYGIGAMTLHDRLGLPIEQCADILRKYHARFPGFRLLYGHYQKLAEDMGYIRMWTGRIRHYGAGIEPHKASSNLIQGGVAEIMRKAILRLDKYCTKYGIYMLLQIHDQVIFEIPEGPHVEHHLKNLKFIMEDFPNFRVPPKVDVKYDRRWGQMVEWQEAI